MSTSASRRNKKVAFQTLVTTEDGYGGEVPDWSDPAFAFAAIYFGAGSEQRRAAQEGGTQTATFEVLSNERTRTLTTTSRVLYPVRDPDPAKWPAWDIQAISEIGLNEGLAIVATRAT